MYIITKNTTEIKATFSSENLVVSSILLEREDKNFFYKNSSRLYFIYTYHT